MDVAQLILSNTDPTDFSLPFLIAVALATPIVVLSTRRRMQRSRATDRTRRMGRLDSRTAMIQKRAESLRTQNSAESEANAAMLELQEYARRVQAQIDNRFQKLEAATRHADGKITELRKLMAQARNGIEPSTFAGGTATGEPIPKPVMSE